MPDTAGRRQWPRPPLPTLPWVRAADAHGRPVSTRVAPHAQPSGVLRRTARASRALPTRQRRRYCGVSPRPVVPRRADPPRRGVAPEKWRPLPAVCLARSYHPVVVRCGASSPSSAPTAPFIVWPRPRTKRRRWKERVAALERFSLPLCLGQMRDRFSSRPVPVVFFGAPFASVWPPVSFSWHSIVVVVATVRVDPGYARLGLFFPGVGVRLSAWWVWRCLAFPLAAVRLFLLARHASAPPVWRSHCAARFARCYRGRWRSLSAATPLCFFFPGPFFSFDVPAPREPAPTRHGRPWAPPAFFLSLFFFEKKTNKDIPAR